MTDTFTYHPQILDELAGHGLRPLPETEPTFLRDAVRELYKYEIKQLRDQLRAGRFLKSAYAGHIVELRKRYWILSVPTGRWLLPADGNPPLP